MSQNWKLLLANKYATVSGGCRKIYVLPLKDGAPAVPHFLLAHRKLQGFNCSREDTEPPACTAPCRLHHIAAARTISTLPFSLFTLSPLQQQ